MKERILQLNGLKVDFLHGSTRHEILKGIDLFIDRKEVIAVLGESGAGKSMLALTILGLLPEYIRKEISGSAQFGEEKTDLLTLRKKHWSAIRGRRIGMIFQDPGNALNPIRPCGDQVREAIRIHQHLSGTDLLTKVKELLTLVGLQETERMSASYPHQLSGGQLQRILIAMALAGNPELLIADEPTSNLDAGARQDIISLIAKLNRELGLSVLYITHDLDEVAVLSSRYYHMEGGKVISSGRTGEGDFIRVRDRFSMPPDFKIPKNTAGQNETLLIASGLVKEYKDSGNLFRSKIEGVKALDGVELEIPVAGTTGVVGISGSGKTTLARVCLNLERPDHGTVHFRGQSVLDAEGAAMRLLRQKMQIVYQNPYNTLNPRMQLQTLIREPLDVHRLYSPSERKQMVIEIMRNTGLDPDLARRHMFQLSGGQRQRVAIARALILRPEFLVLDECVSSLDRMTQWKIIELLFNLQQKFRLSYLFISHDQYLVEKISDRVFQMDSGRLKLIK